MNLLGNLKIYGMALKFLGLPNKISSSDASALKINNTVEHDDNSVLEVLKNYYLTLAENLVNNLLKASNNCSIGTVIKYYEHMIQEYQFNLASVSKKLDSGHFKSNSSFRSSWS